MVDKDNKDQTQTAGNGVADMVAQEVIELGLKLGADLLERQMSFVKIPDLKDVNIEEALRILRDELGLIPTSAVAHPCPAYGDESEARVVYSEPRFGSRVHPKTPIKVYYVTNDVIIISKEIQKKMVQEFALPRIIGLNLYEAREDLEALGLKVSEKTEKPNTKFVDKEECQVTRVTYPNNEKIGSKLKTGERIWLYYVSEDTLAESKRLKGEKEKEKQQKRDRITDGLKTTTSRARQGAKKAAEKISQNVKKPLGKKIGLIEEREEEKFPKE